MNQYAKPLARTVRREQEMKFGTQLTPTGVRFRLWAPHSAGVSVRILDPEMTLAMTGLPRGWFEVEIEGIGHGTRYCFVLEDGTQVPDPASRHQPQDVNGPSEVVDPLAYEWSDLGWRGRPWEEVVFYEIHIGTFTPEGTFRAAIDRLDHLVELGVTAVELMPLADFRGRWNWGYDGALLFAPDASYGRPEDLKALVDAAHARGLLVFLDVVYNHFGPEGNYLTIYAPMYSRAHQTPWGPAVNFDDEGSAMIRDFVMANARYWLNEFRFDGLRFDAVHAIQDSGPKHLLQDLAEQIRAATDGRNIFLVAENSLNHANWLKRGYDGEPWLYDAQWSDDIHHALHATATGERFGYYVDFEKRIDLLGRSLAEGLAWQGEYLERERQHRGEPSAFLPPTAFVSFVQNHDQAGNRPFGERLGHLVPPEAMRAVAAINLLSPHIPLLFMGEEWNAPEPFLYFTDMGPHLADTIRASRKAELREAPGLDGEGGEPPDPMAEETFLASKLDWSVVAQPQAREWLDFYRQLLDLRRREILPRLHDIAGHAGFYEVIGPKAVKVWWTLGDGACLTLWANLSPEPLGDVAMTGNQHLWQQGEVSAKGLGPWTVVFDLGAPPPTG